MMHLVLHDSRPWASLMPEPAAQLTCVDQIWATHHALECVCGMHLQIFRLVFNTRFMWVIHKDIW